ncbi:MAG: hypothetical protein WKF47_15835 [Geodermatophilaceae bacterium]
MLCSHVDDHALEDGLSGLRAAASVEELHRLVVTRRVSGRSTRHQEAVELFVHHHSDDPGGAVDTAVLLCTEWRWNRCTAKLIVGICATGILDDLALDELADRLLWPDRPRVRHPLSWLGLDWTALDLSSGTVVGHGVDQDRPVDVADSLSDGDAQRAINLGLASGRAQVRKVALRVLADRIDAVRRAAPTPTP